MCKSGSFFFFRLKMSSLINSHNTKSSTATIAHKKKDNPNKIYRSTVCQKLFYFINNVFDCILVEYIRVFINNEHIFPRKILLKGFLVS